jgi:surface antigen
MHVYSKGKIMKALVGILLIALTSACSSTGKDYTTSTQTTNASVQSTYQPSNGYVGILVNLTKWNWYRLPPKDGMKQERAMFFALDNSENGQTTSWYNNETGTNGVVQILATFPQGSGYCRTVATRLMYKGKYRNFKETACKETGHTGWRFQT